MKKKLILVGAPPACGKNYLSDLICKSIKNVAYFDKDDLTDLRLCAFDVSGQVADTDGEFYLKTYVRLSIQPCLIWSLRH